MVVKLFIKDPRGEITEIDLSDSEFESYTVLQLKTKIREKTTRDSSQELIFKWCLLEDAAKLSDCGIQHESTIHFGTQPVTTQFFITGYRGRRHTFSLDEDELKSCRVEHLKRRIQDIWRIPDSSQELIFKSFLLEDAAKLSDCGIQHESTIHFGTRRGLQDTFSLAEDEFKSCRVEHLKRRRQDTLRIPGCQQRLIFKGRELTANRFLPDYGIQNDSTIDMCLKLRGGGRRGRKLIGGGPCPERGDGGMGDKGGKNRSMEHLYDL